MRVLSIIVTHNGDKFIERCIFSLKSSSFKVDIIIIDNNSTDSTLQFILEKFSEVLLIKSKENIGFGQANNVGLKYALDHNYDFAFLLNQDAFVSEYTIENLISVSKKNPEFGILSPIHLNGDGEGLDSYFSNYVTEKRCPRLISDFVLRNTLKEIYPLKFVNAAAWLLSISTLKIVGGFDPIFFHYGEDENFCQRLLFHGLQIGVVPNTFICHDRKQGFQNWDIYDKLDVFERTVKVKLADLNVQFQSTLNWELKEIKRRILTSLIGFRFLGFLKWLKFYFHLKSIEPQIQNSRKINRIKGPNYLNG